MYKKSLFDPIEQNSNLANKIVVALERVSEAFRVALWNECKKWGLSPLQAQILLFLDSHALNYCKVSYLATEFNMTKATISDAIKALEQKQWIVKIADTHDTRSFTIGLTAAGLDIVGALAGFADSIHAPIANMDTPTQQALWGQLMRLVGDLQRTGAISVQRMCYTCAHYREQQGAHYCNLLQTTIASEAIRLDCPEHLAKPV